MYSCTQKQRKRGSQKNRNTEIKTLEITQEALMEILIKYRCKKLKEKAIVGHSKVSRSMWCDIQEGLNKEKHSAQ